MIIQITAPTAARPADLAPGRTSVTPAWREALYHVTSMGMWNWNATKQDIMGVYDRTSQLMDNVRKVTPDAAYLVSLVLVLLWFLLSFPSLRSWTGSIGLTTFLLCRTRRTCTSLTTRCRSGVTTIPSSRRSR
jgi:hypothetical protein